MAYEGLNNAGSEGRRLFVILNDNEMSIAPQQVQCQSICLVYMLIMNSIVLHN